MFYVAKRSLDSLPLAEIGQRVHLAGVNVKETIMEEAREIHDRAVQRKIAAIYANREDSYEGDQEADFPFEEPDAEYIQEQVGLAKRQEFALLAEKYDLKNSSSWLLPQMTARIAEIPLTRTEEGRVDSLAYFKEFGKSPELRGLYAIGMHPIRGDLIAKQYAPENKNYSALVPLLLMPHKKFNGVSYSDWDLNGLDKVIDSSLLEAMNCSFDPTSVQKDELLKIRHDGMVVKTGKTAGNSRNPATTHKVYSAPAPFNRLPWLASVMLFQIWVAHPTNRTDLMILNWEDWDNMPEPLISTTVIKSDTPARIQPSKTTKSMDDWE